MYSILTPCIKVLKKIYFFSMSKIGSNGVISFRKFDTPFNSCSEIFDAEFLTRVVEETNFYIVQKQITNCPPTNAAEIRRFFGIITFMSVFHYPNIRSYWESMALVTYRIQ